jgi:hypothetical protein
MPSAAQLPDGLEPLATRQAVELGDATWHQDVDGLVRSLQGGRRQGAGAGHDGSCLPA